MFWILLCFLLMKPFPTHCQDCLWSNIVNVDGKNSPGSNGTLTVNSTKALTGGTDFTWKLNSVGIFRHSYDAASSSFTSVSGDSRYASSIEIVSDDVVTTKLVIENLLRNEDGLVVEITRSGCPGLSGDPGPTITLVIEDCDKTYYQPFAANTTSTACGFGCTELFDCTESCHSGNFQGVCQTDASWTPVERDCPPITCDTLPTFMRFGDGTVNVACGNTKEVECEGGSDLCGNTTGECTRTDNVTTLTNASFNCSAECPLATFLTVANTSANTSALNPRCGGNATFQCFDSLTCGLIEFTRFCQKDGVWNDDSHPCVKTCPGLKDAWIAFIALSILWLVEIAVLILVTQKSDDVKCVKCVTCVKCVACVTCVTCVKCVDWISGLVVKLKGALKDCCNLKYWTAYRILAAVPGSILQFIGLTLLFVSALLSECCPLDDMGIAGVVLSCIGQVYILIFIFVAVRVKDIPDPKPANKVNPEAVELSPQTADA